MKRTQARFSGVVEQRAYKGAMPYLRVPREVAECFVRETPPGARVGPPRMQCTIGETSFACGLMPLGDGDSQIILSKRLRDVLGLVVGSAVRATLTPDTSDYGLPMPEELAEVLAQEEAGAQAFEALTPGRKRGILSMVARHKTSDRRIAHALAIVRAVTEGVTDLKQLARVRLPGPED